MGCGEYRKSQIKTAVRLTPTPLRLVMQSFRRRLATGSLEEGKGALALQDSPLVPRARRLKSYRAFRSFAVVASVARHGASNEARHIRR